MRARHDFWHMSAQGVLLHHISPHRSTLSRWLPPYRRTEPVWTCAHLGGFIFWSCYASPAIHLTQVEGFQGVGLPYLEEAGCLAIPRRNECRIALCRCSIGLNLLLACSRGPCDFWIEIGVTPIQLFGLFQLLSKFSGHSVSVIQDISDVGCESGSRGLLRRRFRDR
jgi:hypothetical protein